MVNPIRSEVSNLLRTYDSFEYYAEQHFTTTHSNKQKKNRYGTHCSLQPPHLVLALMVAMTQAYKLKNFITAASFARRLLEVNERFASSKSSKSMSSAAKKAEKVLKLSERQGRNSVKIEYDEQDSFMLCCETMTPIYKGNKKTRCPYCFAHYLPKHSGEVCKICGVAQIGLETLGLVSFSSSRR